MPILAVVSAKSNPMKRTSHADLIQYGSAKKCYEQLTGNGKHFSISCPGCGCSGCLVLRRERPRICRDFGEHSSETGRRLKSKAESYSIIHCLCTQCHMIQTLETQMSPPYRLYSYDFILCSLDRYYRDRSPAAVCDEKGIPQSTLYSWKDQFETDVSVFLSIPPEKVTADRCRNFLRHLQELDFELFLHVFHARVGRMFLQTHRNPKASRGRDGTCVRDMVSSCCESLEEEVIRQFFSGSPEEYSPKRILRLCGQEKRELCSGCSIPLQMAAMDQDLIHQMTSASWIVRQCCIQLNRMEPVQDPVRFTAVRVTVLQIIMARILTGTCAIS